MTYRNKKSGVTFTTSCVCTGEDWEEVKASTPKAASAPSPKTKGGKKQESAADAETADSDTEDS